MSWCEKTFFYSHENQQAEKQPNPMHERLSSICFLLDVEHYYMYSVFRDFLIRWYSIFCIFVIIYDERHIYQCRCCNGQTPKMPNEQISGQAVTHHSSLNNVHSFSCGVWVMKATKTTSQEGGHALSC